MGLPDFETAFDIAFCAARTAVWADDPLEQIAINLLIIVAAMLSTSVGFAPGVVIVMIAMFFIAVAVIRLIVGFIMG